MTDDARSAGAPALRASDAERERTATLLREHCAAGRLTPEELAERLDGAYAARTVGELDMVVADLPPADPPRAGRSPERELARSRLLHVAGYVTLVSVVCVVIWAAAGANGYFWPAWVLLASAIRVAFTAWAELGPAGAGSAHAARHGRGGAQPPELRRGDPPER